MWILSLLCTSWNLVVRTLVDFFGYSACSQHSRGTLLKLVQETLLLRFRALVSVHLPCNYCLDKFAYWLGRMSSEYWAPDVRISLLVPVPQARTLVPKSETLAAKPISGSFHKMRSHFGLLLKVILVFGSILKGLD